jgi:hypothetical protein
MKVYLEFGCWWLRWSFILSITHFMSLSHVSILPLTYSSEPVTHSQNHRNTNPPSPTWIETSIAIMQTFIISDFCFAFKQMVHYEVIQQLGVQNVDREPPHKKPEG